MRIAIVHDWLTGMRGGERCLEAALDLYPQAELFTLVHRRGSVSHAIEARPIHTSFVDRIPGAATFYRHLLPLFPAAVERFDLRGFDLVLSFSHCAAKGVRPPPGVPHLCYCFTPMRYVWDQYDDYFGPDRASWPVRLAVPALARRLRRWDAATARRVDSFLTSSEHVRGRIRRCYGREARVVHPPVRVESFRPAAAREDFYLVAGALVPYKRAELAVRACTLLGRRLVVAGTGPELPRLRRLAGPTVEFRGWIPDDEVRDLMGRCRALLFPQLEEFGIAAVEAQAAGAPVIAYGDGGALETVIPAGADGRGPGAATGVFFREQTVEDLALAIVRFEGLTFDAEAIRRNATRFSPERFRAGLAGAVDRLLEANGANGAANGGRRSCASSR